jgi:ADP-ribose pyrophosphatase
MHIRSVKIVLFLILLISQFLYGNLALDQYFSYIEQLSQPLGSYKEGEIEIVLETDEISRIQKIQEDRLVQKGFSKEEALEFSRVGIVNEDQYWIWLRDAVYFPKGVTGTYDRLLWKSELKTKSPGVAVLPILPSGRIVLILNYRHATRSWELELPRGGINPQETLEEAARRELKEETGLLASSVVPLGEIATDTGVHSSIIPVFMGHVTKQEESSPEDSEAIAGVLSFTKQELREGLLKGYLNVVVHGKEKQVPLRDAFLTFALLQAEIRNLL